MTVSPIHPSLINVALLGLALLAGCEEPKTKPPIPQAEKIPKVFDLHGERRVDNYYWLRERDNPKVLAYLKEENAYAEAMMEHTNELRKALYDEFVSRLQETDQSVPRKEGDYYYYTRIEEKLDYVMHCRKRSTLDAAEEILLDENKLAKGQGFFALGAFEVSPNQEQLAYSVDNSGAERFALRFKNLRNGKTYDETIANTSKAIAWGSDNQTVFYVTLDAANRPHKAFRHKLGDDPRNDVLVFEEPDESYVLGVSNTSSKSYVLLELISNTSGETHFLKADNPTGKFTVIQPRQKRMEYYVGHQGDRLLILTNDKAENFRLVETPVATPGMEHWHDVIAHREDVKLETLHVFSSHAVLTARSGGLMTLLVRDLESGESHFVIFDEASYMLEPDKHAEFESTHFRFLYESMLTPKSVYDYDLVERKRELKKQDKVLGGYDAAQYVSDRIFATAPDGTRVPLSIAYKRGLARDGRNPCLLDGYGAYGVSNDPVFSAELISLLDRGFVFAMAHVRGGGENGRAWYENGKLFRKKNSFTDFIAGAEHLVAEKYTSPDKLAIRGTSAGGLLIATVTNMRPDLFRAVVADVPFVDGITTMLDTSIPLTVMEFEEWGNPTIKAEYDLLRSYSPYDNVKAQKYPHLLILAGLNDNRVAYWEPAKFAAKLRSTKTDDRVLILKTNMSAGHFGGSGRYEVLEERAFEYAFLLDRLGVK